MPTIIRGAIAALALAPAIALAGGEATIRAGSDGGSALVDIIWSDDGMLRMQNQGDSTYFLVRDGDAYVVTQQGGRTMVMDMAAMLKMAGGNAGNMPKQSFGRVDSIEATGTTETVAGIEGRVYRMEWTDHEGRQRSGDAVLTDDAVVEEMTQAYLSAVQALSGGNADEFRQGLPDGERGLLRGGDDFRVESIAAGDAPAGTFELPAEPMDLKKLMQGR